MKYSLALLGAAAGFAVAESISDYMPECSVECLTKAISDATKCKGPEDLDCFCEVDNYRAIYDSGVTCVLLACGQDSSMTEVLPAAASMCEVVVGRSGGPTTVPFPSSSAPAASTPSAPANNVSTPAPSAPSAASESVPAAPSSTAAAAGIAAGVMGAVAPLVVAALL